MGAPKKNKTIIVEDFCRRHLHTPTHAIAKEIYAKYPMLFKDQEAARKVVRRLRGSTGEFNRKNILDKSLFGTGKKIIEAPDDEDVTPLLLDRKNNNIGVFGDFHIPNHRPKPIEVAVNYFIEHEINTLIINGDLLDNTPFQSKYPYPPPGPDKVRNIFDTAENFLKNLRDLFPKARILFLEGNHDWWYERWLMSKAEILFGDPYYRLQSRLHFDNYKIEFIPQKRYVMAGKLAICHGHHLVKGIIAPVNAARGVYLKTKKSTLINHVHVESSHTEPDLHGDIITTWSLGCMCTLSPDYQPFGGKACHGFAHVTTENSGNFSVKNFRIHKGKIL